MEYKDGSIAVPDKPGLGVTLNREKLAEYAELYRRLRTLSLRPGSRPTGLDSDCA